MTGMKRFPAIVPTSGLSSLLIGRMTSLTKSDGPTGTKTVLIMSLRTKQHAKM